MKIRRIGCIVGKTGYGKSHLLKVALDRLPDTVRVVIFDIMGEYQQNWPVITDLETFKHSIKSDRFQIILRLESLDDYETALRMISVVGNCWVIMEEVSNFCSAFSMSPELERLIRFGRHKSISFIGITQRFGDLSVLFRNNIDLLVAFNTTAPNDLKYLAEIPYIGESAEKIGRLPKYKFLSFRNF